jgi:transcription initiation factor TFIIIB Brf1 subunit/transcription initiation factor TFIIB
VPKDVKGKALAEAKRAQLDYERKLQAAREERRKSFARAQKAGSSLAEIGEAVGLHRSRVGEILRGK